MNRMFLSVVFAACLALPATAQRKLGKVVATGVGTCLIAPYARTVPISKTTSNMQIASACNGHDIHGWVGNAYVLIGMQYSQLAIAGNLLGNVVQPIAILPAGNHQCFGDVIWEGSFVPQIRAYAQVIAQLPGCKNEWHASPVLRLDTGASLHTTR